MWTDQPFTRMQAISNGITDAALKGPRYHRVFTGVHVSSRVSITTTVRAQAALLLLPPGAFVCGTSAAELLGLPVAADSELHVGVAHKNHARRRRGLRCHVIQPRPTTCDLSGVTVATGADLFVQLADLPLVDLVVVGDALVRRGLTTLRELRDVCADNRGRRWRHVCRAAGLVRERVDSPTETRLRLLLVLAGFPEPQINYVVGRFRVDLAWPLLRLGLEYDGQHHRADLDQWNRDIHRNEWFDDQDWRLLHVTSRHLFREPAALLDRVYDAYVSRRGRPFQLSQEWRAHFPSAELDAQRP